MFGHVVLSVTRFCRGFSGSENGRPHSGPVPSLNAHRALAFALILGGAAHADPFFWNPSTVLLNGSGGGEVGASANWSQLANGGGNWPKSGFDDDFANDGLNTNWKLRDADADLNTGTANLTINADQLTLSGRGKDVWWENNQYMAVYRDDIKGDFDVSVDVASLTGNTDPWAKAGIMIANDYLDFTKGGCFAVTVTNTNGVKVQFDTLGVVGEYDYPEGPGLAGAAPVSLRVARKGGVFYGYWKKNKGDPWILLRTGVPVGTAANSQIGLFMTSHNPAATGTAVFDNFQASGPVLASNLDMNFKGTTATANANALLNTSMTALTVDMTGYTGIFAFGSNSLTVTGAKADFGITAAIDAGTGSLAFTAGSGTQVFSPAKAGSVFPAIAKTGGGTLQITSRPLTAGVLTMSGGVFDLGNRTNEFTGLNASSGAFTALGAGDTLILSGDADFSGVTAMPSTGNLQIRSKSSPTAAKNVLFTPGAAPFSNVYLWAIGSAGFPARITVASGTLQAKGNLILRDELMASGRGTLDFQTHNVNVTVDGNILRAENGSAGSPSQQLLMGGGTWTSKGNVALSFQNSGAADNSTLDLTAVSPAVQTLTISNGSVAQVKHSGSGTLNLGSALNGAGLTQTAGVLNFDGNNVNVTGNISVTNGGSATFIGLGGRTLSAGGTVTLAGKAGNLLNLNPGANWSVSGGAGVSADFAAIAKSAVISAPDGNATSACKDQGGNSHWIFAPLTTPPAIVTQPGDVTVLTGVKAEFTVTADGAPGFTYEWRKRGQPVVVFAGQTLVLDPTAASDSGSRYYCTVKNEFGEADTRDALLNVNDPAHFLLHPASVSVVADNPAAFKVSAKGSGKLSFKWKRKSDTANTVGTDSVFTLAKTTASQSGWTYFCIVSNLYGEAVSTEAVLTVNTIPAIGTQPRDTVVLAGQVARFTVAATGSPALAYQWYRKGDPAKLAETPILTVPTAAGDDTARYYCVVTNPHGEAVSYAAKLTVGVVPVITLEPSDTSALAGAPASFKLRAVGSPVLGYSWKKVGVGPPLTGDSVLSFAAVTAADSGSQYFCVVANGHGSDTSVKVTLRVNRPAAVVRQPRDTAVAAGQAASFSVGAMGSGKLEFVWRKKGDTTVVSRDSLLTFKAALLSDSGALFACTVSNPYGTAVTREAKLTVVQAALITREPADLFVGLGKKAVFTVGAIGAKPMVYKWRRGTDTAGISKDSLYTLDSVKLSDDGRLFSVIVKNDFGADTSRQARLNVVVCDSVFQVAPETLTVDEGQPVVLKGKAACAQSRFWSVVKGPAPRILDPEVDTLRLTAPRVEGDSLIVYRFTADYGGNPITKDVSLKIRNSIPDPLFTLPAKAKWNGSTPFKLKPALTNAADLAKSPYSPAFHYQWFLSIPIADTIQSKDTLILADPEQDGILEVTLCLDNGGLTHCAVSEIDVDRMAVRLVRPRAFSGPVSLAGDRISWNSPVRVRVSDWQGRLLWDRRGRPGESAQLPPAALRSLRSRVARLEILP
jgi:hypothetical protein